MAAGEILKGVREYEEEIRFMDAEWLREQFGFVSSGRVNVAKLMRNLIWQAYTRIRDGKRETIDSNTSRILSGVDPRVCGGDLSPSSWTQNSSGRSPRVQGRPISVPVAGS